MVDQEILPPAEPADIPPPTEQPHNGNSNDMGFNIIREIYDLFHLKKPIAFSVVLRYKKQLDLQIDFPWLYYPALIIGVIIDLALALIVVLSLAIMFIAVTLSFMRGIGIFDWLPQLFGIGIK